MNQLIHKISLYLKLILGVSLLFQCALYPRTSVFVGCVVSWLSLYFFLHIVFKEQVIKFRPLSFLAMLGLQMFTYFAPIFTLLEGHPIDYKMLIPTETFLWQSLYIIVCFCSFYITRNIGKNYPYIRNFLYKIGYFNSVSDHSLWLLGFVGVIGRLYLLRNQFGDEATAGAGTVYLFVPFITAPYCILFKNLYESSTINKKNYFALLLYSLLILLMAISSNARNSIASIMMTVLLMGVLYVVYYDNTFINRFLSFSLQKIVAIIAIIYIVIGPLTNISIAMVSVRALRSDLSARQLMNETLDLAFDSERMAKVRAVMEVGSLDVATINSYLDWDESYVNSVFIQRISNYLVADKTLFYAKKVGFPSKKLISSENEKLKIIFPQPIVNFLYGYIDKSKFNYTTTDYLRALATGTRRIDSYIVGGDVGLGLVIYGYFFPIVQLLLYSFIFYFLDQLYYIRRNQVVVPLITLLGLYDYFFTFMVGTGISGRMSAFLWAVPSGILIKCFIVKLFSYVK